MKWEAGPVRPFIAFVTDRIMGYKGQVYKPRPDGLFDFEETLKKEPGLVRSWQQRRLRELNNGSAN